jgi:hypothetical protein
MASPVPPRIKKRPKKPPPIREPRKHPKVEFAPDDEGADALEFVIETDWSPKPN